MKSPLMKRIVTDQKVRTPIGKLVIRKVAHSNQFEDTQYAVEVVHKFQRQHAEIIQEMTPPSCNNHQAMMITTDTPNRSHPFLRSKTATNKASPNGNGNYSLPRPRLILHRISTLQEYQKHCGASLQTSDQTVRTGGIFVEFDLKWGVIM